MKRNGTLYDISDDALASLASEAAAGAVREIRAGGLTPAGLMKAAPARRKAAPRRPLGALAKSAKIPKSAVRGA